MISRLIWKVGAGAVLSALLAACGGGGSSSADAFVGRWTYSEGMLVPSMCTVPVIGEVPPISQVGQSMTITKESDSRLSVDAGSGCVLKFSLSGSTATADAGQTCTVMSVVVLQISSWTLVLSGDSLTSTQSGSAAIGGPSCTAMGTGTLMRSSGDAGAG